MTRKELKQTLFANIFSVPASRSLYILKMMHDRVIKQITLTAGANVWSCSYAGIMQTTCIIRMEWAISFTGAPPKHHYRSL
jgi:hypothetical protein